MEIDPGHLLTPAGGSFAGFKKSEWTSRDEGCGAEGGCDAGSGGGRRRGRLQHGTRCGGRAFPAVGVRVGPRRSCGGGRRGGGLDITSGWTRTAVSEMVMQRANSLENDFRLRGGRS